REGPHWRVPCAIWCKPCRNPGTPGSRPRREGKLRAGGSGEAMPAKGKRWIAAIASVALLPTVVLAQVAAPGEPPPNLPPIVVEGKQIPAKKRTPRAPQKQGSRPSPPPQAPAEEPVASVSMSPAGGSELPVTK